MYIHTVSPTFLGQVQAEKHIYLYIFSSGPSLQFSDSSLLIPHAYDDARLHAHNRYTACDPSYVTEAIYMDVVVVQVLH